MLGRTELWGLSAMIHLILKSVLAFGCGVDSLLDVGKHADNPLGIAQERLPRFRAGRARESWLAAALNRLSGVKMTFTVLGGLWG